MKTKKYNCELCQDRGTLPSMEGPWSERCDCKLEEKKYYLVCYMRVRAEDVQLMSRDQAKVEAEQARLMQPEHIFRIESIDE